jgi:uncharacterized protein
MNKWVKQIKSKIHGSGIIAKKDIPKGTRIIEYLGVKITKKKSEELYERMLEAHKKDMRKGSVYVFDLNKKYDLDGNFSWNLARLINHSCDENTEAENIKGKIWIIAKKDIPKGAEITYDYGYSIDSYKDHPCRCGSKNCAKYIVGKRQRWRIK